MGAGQPIAPLALMSETIVARSAYSKALWRKFSGVTHKGPNGSKSESLDSTTPLRASRRSAAFQSSSSGMSLRSGRPVRSLGYSSWIRTRRRNRSSSRDSACKSKPRFWQYFGRVRLHISSTVPRVTCALMILCSKSVEIIEVLPFESLARSGTIALLSRTT